MDNICHSLVGAAISYAGMRRWSARATLLLVAAANAPDVDIVAAMMGRNLEGRRGITHGVPALLVWPWVIAAIFWLAERRRPDGASYRRLALMAAVGVVTHPALDYLNTYGMRWLMPVVDRWFYGDTLFIVDPWLYLLLGVGVARSARAFRRGDPDPVRPARRALAASAGYVGVMMALMLLVRRTLVAAGAPAASLMVAPVPANPLVREYVADAGDSYRVGRFTVLGWRVTEEARVAKGDLAAGAAAVAVSREGRAFLHWSRFPVARREGADWVVFDLRYSNGGGDDWASRRVTASGGR